LKKRHHCIHSAPPVVFPGLNFAHGHFDVLQIFFNDAQSGHELNSLIVPANERRRVVGERRGGRGAQKRGRMWNYGGGTRGGGGKEGRRVIVKSSFSGAKLSFEYFIGRLVELKKRGLPQRSDLYHEG
jgi:hypothetical protein